mmetsp:Transcript_20195/g.51541  ORF Transcript_20195/g.51541 Transcript_20195/m.51541 type:complete len:249 (+) Transcript_20195:186-932(+)
MAAFGCAFRRAAFFRNVKSLGRRYADFSDKRPFVCSILTAGTVLSTADIACQTLSLREGETHDWRRTVALTTWGTWHYGVPQKYFYLLLDRWLGPGNALLKMFLDVYVNCPLYLIPSFYFATGIMKGRQTLPEIGEQLRSEWREASLGTAIFWTPLVLANFHFVPQHSRILVVLVFSFFHKTWLSWVSNRKLVAAERGEVLDVKVEVELAPEGAKDAARGSPRWGPTEDAVVAGALASAVVHAAVAPA